MRPTSGPPIRRVVAVAVCLTIAVMLPACSDEELEDARREAAELRVEVSALQMQAAMNEDRKNAACERLAGAIATLNFLLSQPGLTQQQRDAAQQALDAAEEAEAELRCR